VAPNNQGNRKLIDAESKKQAMEKQESKKRFPTFPQPRRPRTITTYGMRILRARSDERHSVITFAEFLPF
jgi:hypothetical protein